MKSNRPRSGKTQNAKGHHGGSTQSIAKRKGEEAIKPNMRKCPHPGCGKPLLDRDYDKHVRAHEKHEIKRTDVTHIDLSKPLLTDVLAKHVKKANYKRRKK
jgi:hypothetical protein